MKPTGETRSGWPRRFVGRRGARRGEWLCADELRQRVDVAVKAVVGDVTTDHGRNALLGAIDKPDMLITNSAGPAPASLQSLNQGARRRQEDSIAAKRLGRPEELGATCPFLRSRNAGYITGNDIHLEGTNHPALL